ncbi:MAG: DUF937 domain-containing protein [Methylococcales bacterium]|nr:DUF937 domain-containing protein [Methylococcales bacterium]
MDLMKLGTQLVLSKLGGNTSESGIQSALSSLLGGNDSKDGGLDLGSLVSGMMTNGGGLSSIVGSWLGDGDNEAVSGSQIKDMLGSDKISEFASKLGVDEDSAADSLAEAVPQMVDKGSSGGSLLDSVGGISGAIDMAKKFLS